MKYAFRCKNCGRLEGSAAAGECEHPHACRVCGAGVVMTMNHPNTLMALADQHGAHVEFKSMPVGAGIHKVIDHTPWEILAECDAERLAEIGLGYDDVEEHVPAASTSDASPRLVDRTAYEGTKMKDKAG